MNKDIPYYAKKLAEHWRKEGMGVPNKSGVSKYTYTINGIQVTVGPTPDTPSGNQSPQTIKIDPDGCEHGIPWDLDCGWCFQAGEKVRGPDDSRLKECD